MYKVSDYSWPANIKILIVEDNKVNQKVATGILKMIGLKVDLAANGLIALEKLQNSAEDRPYTLILMDCQMPEMDGYEATAAIRAGKAGKRYQLIPILAMTANALQGDEEQCLQAGMSDYLTKPMNATLLKGKIQQWISKPDDGQIIAEKCYKNSIKLSASVIWDKQDALNRVMGDEELLSAVIDVFLSDIPIKIRALERAIDDNDGELISRTAHAIKGSAANLSFKQLQEQALLIEQAGKANDIKLVAEMLNSLLEANKLLSTQIEGHIKTAEKSESIEPLNNSELGTYFQQLKLKLEKSLLIDQDKLSTLNKISTTTEIENLAEQVQVQIRQFNNTEALVLLDKLATKMSYELNKEY